MGKYPPFILLIKAFGYTKKYIKTRNYIYIKAKFSFRTEENIPIEFAKQKRQKFRNVYPCTGRNVKMCVYNFGKVLQ